jgi:hypothetical protein
MKKTEKKGKATVERKKKKRESNTRHKMGEKQRAAIPSNFFNTIITNSLQLFLICIIQK